MQYPATTCRRRPAAAPAVLPAPGCATSLATGAGLHLGIRRASILALGLLLALSLMLAGCASTPLPPAPLPPATTATPTTPPSAPAGTPPAPAPVIITTETGVQLDISRSATGQDSRVLFLILHYTVADLPWSLKILTERDVSAHYLLTDETPPRIYRLVDENRRAWHSGVSGWKGHRLLNASSIGIEIVHPGFRLGPDKERIYQPFPEAQIQALIALVRDIVQRHQIRPERVLGHGEVTPAYKEDPGPTFPWHRLAEAGLVPPLPDPARVAAARAAFEVALPDAAWFQQALATHGYVVERTGQFDAQTQRVLMNMQMRYRPADYRGLPDAETAALLHVLTLPPPGATTPAPALPATPFPLGPRPPEAPATALPPPAALAAGRASGPTDADVPASSVPAALAAGVAHQAPAKAGKAAQAARAGAGTRTNKGASAAARKTARSARPGPAGKAAQASGSVKSAKSAKSGTAIRSARQARAAGTTQPAQPARTARAGTPATPRQPAAPLPAPQAPR
jgi:N-acetylmuramoyl-L-alanine amidase